MTKKKKINIVVIGGGTGVAAILSGLKTLNSINLTAILPSSDEGGSTGKFISAYKQRIKLGDKIEFSPPGDIAHALISLSQLNKKQLQILNYRFNKLGTIFKTHNLRNLSVGAALELYGIDGIKELYDIYKIRDGHNAYPVTNQFVPIEGILENNSPFRKLIVKSGEKVSGEAAIDLLPYELKKTKKIIGIKLVPLSKTTPKIYPKVRSAILKANLIVFAPSDIWTSLVPILLISGTREALKKTKSKIVFFCPIMTKRLHSDNWSVKDFIRVIEKYTHSNIFNFVVFNNGKIKQRDLNYYEKEGASPVKLGDKNEIIPRIIEIPLLDSKAFVQEPEDQTKRSILRHDAKKVAKFIQSLLKK